MNFWRASGSVVFMVLSALSMNGQGNDVHEPKSDFIVLPDKLMQVDKKYPDAHIMMVLADCHEDAQGNYTGTTLPDGDLSLRFTGNGYDYTSVSHDKCSISYDLKTSSTVPGSVLVEVLQKGVTIQKAKGILHFADPLAGPTPSSPQVDVMWAPISYDVCKSAFGRSVASKFFCIGVQIGNNSGYQLQIAGVGFETKYGPKQNTKQWKTPNSSYALTRAVAQGGASQTWRAYLVNGTSATGLLMTGVSPFFHSPHASVKWGIGTSIVSNALLNALNLLIPDQTTQQFNNLDDQSLRDGKLIPNNTQIRTVVFLDKGSVSPYYKEACDDLYKAYDSTEKKFATHPVEDNQATIGAISTGDANNYLQCTNGKTSDGLKQALGDLVIIGDKIEYIERIVVDQKVTSQEVPAAVHVTNSSLEYNKLKLIGSDINKLQATIEIEVDAPALGKVKANVDSQTVSATSATYTLEKPFRTHSAPYKVLSTMLPVPPTGTLTNPYPSIDSTVALSNWVITLTGSALDVLPESLIFTSDTDPGISYKATLKDGATAAKASYDLNPAPADKAKVPTTLTINKQPGDPVEASKQITIKK